MTMNALRLIGLAAALAFASSAALAFQEQQSGAPAAVPAPADAKTEIAPDAASPAAVASGTEVRIPGLGKLGVLPKMDFGLELLYGAAERKPTIETPSQAGEDLQIRGSVKHRF